MDMSQLYAPFRDGIRKLSLLRALERIWQLERLAAVSGVIKLQVGGGPAIDVYVWELHLLCREVVLHADGTEDVLATPTGLLQMIDHLRRIKTDISKRTIHSSNDAMKMLHPLMHQQGRWQHSRDEARAFRAFHIFSDPELAPIFEKTTGVTVRAIFTMALAIGGAAQQRPGTTATQDFTGFDVPDHVRDAFFRMAGGTLKEIRRDLTALQCYDERWEFTWNALEGKPLINTDDQHPDQFWCPLPGLLLRRVTEGLFYDLGKSKKFSNEYGHAFERYVGRVLHELFEADKFSVSAEQPYVVAGQEKHGTDWTVSDASGHLFIECKTRRITQKAKEIAEGEALNEVLDDLAGIIIQTYKNADDATRGLATWKPGGLPIHPFVVTYEDWFLFAAHVVDHLTERVQHRLKEANLPATLTTTMPFFVTSISEFEMAGQDIARIGIHRFCTAVATTVKYRHFQLSARAQQFFSNEVTPHRRLLESSWDEIFPKMREWAGMAGVNEDWWTQPGTGAGGAG